MRDLDIFADAGLLERAALVVACATSLTGAALAGCGSDGASDAQDAGTSDDGAILPNTDGGGPFTDGGCIKQDGPRSGKVAASKARTSSATTKPWATPENALTVDNMFASAEVDEGEETEEIRVSDFGFKVPTGARITGIVVQLKRQAPQAGIVDGLINLTFGDRPSSRPKYISTGWPDAIVGTHHYGYFEEDTWGDDVTPNDVDQPTFGVTFWAKRREDAGTGARPANVESILVSVFYCE